MVRGLNVKGMMQVVMPRCGVEEAYLPELTAE